VAKLKLVGRSETFERLTQKALNHLAQSDRAEFASNLATARFLWRKHRELVEAPHLPELLRAAYIEAFPGGDPDDEGCDYEDHVLAPDFPAQWLPEARKIAQGWILRGVGAKESDTKLLEEMASSSSRIM